MSEFFVIKRLYDKTASEVRTYVHFSISSVNDIVHNSTMELPIILKL
jgi:hypothetical protein